MLTNIYATGKLKKKKILILTMFNSLGYCAELVFKDAPGPRGIIRKYLPVKRAHPDVFIVGAQKSGTTSLFNLLCQHKNVLPPQLKEPFFWGNNDRVVRGMSFYMPNFPSMYLLHNVERKSGQKCITFDATTNYLDNPLAAQRIKTQVPDAKIIIILRDPVLRAHSHYKMAVRNGLESLSFKHAIELEDVRISSDTNKLHNYCRQRLGYRTRGQYAELLPPWLTAFTEENLLILCAEDFFADTPGYFKQVLNFLNLTGTDGINFTPQNVSGNKENIPADVQANLEKYFKPWNKKLELLLNRKFPWEYNE